MLRTRQPALILQAIAAHLAGKRAAAVTALIVLALALTLAWIVLASLGRAATLKALFEYFRGSAYRRYRPAWRLTSLMGLNFLARSRLLAAIVGVVGAVLLAGVGLVASRSLSRKRAADLLDADAC